MSLILSDIFLYPVKSTMGHRVEQANVEPRGLAGDRRWMLVDANGRFVTQRENGRLTLIHSVFDGQQVRLQAKGFDDLILCANNERVNVTVWNEPVSARAATDDAARWLQSVLGTNVRAVFMDEQSQRDIDPDYARPNEPVSFADVFPLLFIGEGSLTDLNSRLAKPVDMRRFRPNLVVSGAEAFAEDQWRAIEINGLRFDLVKPCSRCVLTTRDPDNGELDEGREPLRTLASYRRQAKGVMFGQNVVVRQSGTIKRGATIKIVD